MYKKKSNAKSIETSYLFYIKPQFYINMNFGFGYEYFKYNSGIATNIYNLKVGVYGRGSKDTNKTIKFHPLFNYEYYIDENYDTEYDIVKAGMILVFNDIGIEPSYSWIDKNNHEFSLKINEWGTMPSLPICQKIKSVRYFFHSVFSVENSSREGIFIISGGAIYFLSPE